MKPPALKTITVAQALFTQGFGARRTCRALVLSGQVALAAQTCEDPDLPVQVEGLVLQVAGEDWPYHAQALILMHKPAGFECSQKPRHHASVYSLLPPPLRQRGVQAIGRLDEDTTGLLLFTDDGALIHRLTSPKHHVPKDYEVLCRHAVDDAQLQQLLAGVLLHDEDITVRAAACEQTGSNSLRLTLTEGKYHQVKRMLAAVGNRVDGLHRSRFGAMALPDDLLPGQWCWLPGPQALQPAAASEDP